MVNDGSTDDTTDLLRKWASQQDNIRVIEQNNQGQGHARNAGFLVSSGRYILFADVDDFFDPRIASEPVDLAEELNSDILEFGFRDWNVDESPLPTTYGSRPKATRLSPRSAFFELFPAAWGKVYSADYLRRVGVRYPGYKYEDNVEIQRLCCEGGNFHKTPQVYYFYFQNPHGTVRTSRNKLDLFSAIQDLENLVAKYPEYTCELLVRIESLLADLEDSLHRASEPWAVESRGDVAVLKRRLAPAILDNPYYRLPRQLEAGRKRKGLALAREKVKSLVAVFGYRGKKDPNDRWSNP
jgi:hypothetical protein